MALPLLQRLAIRQTARIKQAVKPNAKEEVAGMNHAKVHVQLHLVKLKNATMIRQNQILRINF